MAGFGFWAGKTGPAENCSTLPHGDPTDYSTPMVTITLAKREFFGNRKAQTQVFGGAELKIMAGFAAGLEKHTRGQNHCIHSVILHSGTKRAYNTTGHNHRIHSVTLHN